MQKTNLTWFSDMKSRTYNQDSFNQEKAIVIKEIIYLVTVIKNASSPFVLNWPLERSMEVVDMSLRGEAKMAKANDA